MSEINVIWDEVDGKPREGYLLVADLHFHHTPYYRFRWGVELLSAIGRYSPYIKGIFFLGDVFEVGNRIDSAVINHFLKFIGNIGEIPIYWVTGQHDIYVSRHNVVNTKIQPRASLYGLSYIKPTRLIVIDDYLLFNDEVAFLAYHYDYELYKQKLESIPRQVKILFTHLPIKEALPIHNKKLLSVKAFRNFDQVISGDIHEPQTIENFTYVGIPFPRDFREEKVVGRMMLWDGDNFYPIKIEHPVFITVRNKYELDFLYSLCEASPNILKFVRVNESLQEQVTKLSNIRILGILPDETTMKEMSKRVVSGSLDYRSIMTRITEGEANQKELLDFGFTLLKKVR